MENSTRLAVIQAAPVFMDTGRTLSKIHDLMREAATMGANILLFPESFIPAYPYWAWTMPPNEQISFFCELYSKSITIPGPETAVLCEWAHECHLLIVIGVNERDSDRFGTLYNTNVIIGADGRLLGKHRKLVPTFAEKLVWAPGDGSTYQVYDTPGGRVGTLACGENTNPLARFALLAQGEQIHLANFPAFPFANWYEEAEAIRIRAQAHAFEGKIFVGCSTSLFDRPVIEYLGGDARLNEKFSGKNYALSGIFGPSGQPVSEILIDEEGICCADCDLSSCIAAKMMHDVTGGYNNFAVLSLKLDRRPHLPLHYAGQTEREQHWPDEPIGRAPILQHSVQQLTHPADVHGGGTERRAATMNKKGVRS